jgi:hypothetical protein
LQFGGFYRDYFGDYRVRSYPWFEYNLRGGMAEIIHRADDGDEIWISQSLQWADYYWPFYLDVFGRRELGPRTHFLDPAQARLNDIGAGYALCRAGEEQRFLDCRIHACHRDSRARPGAYTFGAETMSALIDRLASAARVAGCRGLRHAVDSASRSSSCGRRIRGDGTGSISITSSPFSWRTEKRFRPLTCPWGYAYYLAPFYWAFGPTPLPALDRPGDPERAGAAARLRLRGAGVRSPRRRCGDGARGRAFVQHRLRLDRVDRFGLDGNFHVPVTRLRARPSHESRSLVRDSPAFWRDSDRSSGPNLVLLPVVPGALNWLLGPRTWLRLRQGALVAIIAALMLATVDVAQLSVEPPVLADQHARRRSAVVRLLQTGPYVESRAHNPRSYFCHLALRLHQPHARAGRIRRVDELPSRCAAVGQSRLPSRSGDVSSRFALTGRRRRSLHRRNPVRREGDAHLLLHRLWPGRRNLADAPHHITPAGGADDPLVFFVSDRHTADLDADGALLDIFDVARVVRHLAWQEQVPGCRQTGSRPRW